MRSLRIETARLLLLPFSRDDVDALHRLWTAQDVRKYLWDGVVIPREQTASIIEKSLDYFTTSGFGIWAVRERSQESLMGFCGFWFFHSPPELELVYGISAEFWGQGFATEAATAMLQYGFDELSFERIEASTDAPNTASVGVMVRAGMTFWKREPSEGLDTIFYSISRAEFYQKNAPVT